jgi:putative transposase
VTFAFSHAEKAEFPVGMLCEQLEVSRGGYCAWLGRPVSKRRCRDAGLGAQVAQIHSSHAHPVAPNVLNRNFTTTAPDLAWVGDITYIWTRQG